MFFPDFSAVIWGAPRQDASSSRCHVSGPRCSEACRWCHYTFRRCFVLLSWPAGMPSWGLILSWNWCIYVYTPHPLRHSWSLPVTIIHFADVYKVKYKPYKVNLFSIWGINILVSKNSNVVAWCWCCKYWAVRRYWIILNVTLWNVVSPRGLYISKMYFSLWKPPEVSERMWSVNLEGSISEEYQTVGGHSGRPSEKLRSPLTVTGVPW
jgi:hypothetical protein